MCTHPNAFLVSDWLICVFVTSNGSDGVRARLLCRFLFRRFCPRDALTPGRLGGRRWPSHALQYVAKRKRPSVGPDAARTTHNDGVSDQVTNTVLGRGKRRARGAKGSERQQAAAKARANGVPNQQQPNSGFKGRSATVRGERKGIRAFQSFYFGRLAPAAAAPCSRPIQQQALAPPPVWTGAMAGEWRASPPPSVAALSSRRVERRLSVVCRLAVAINPDRATDHSYPLPHVESSISIHHFRRTPPIHKTAAAGAAARASGYRVRATKEGNAWPGLGSSGHSHGSSSERRRRGGGVELKGSGLRAS